MKQFSRESISEVKNYLLEISLFADLNETSLQILAHDSKFKQVKKEQFIFLQSDPSETVYIVRSGIISIILESSDGRKLVINEVRTGEFFGEVGVLTNQPRSTSAIARRDSELLVIPLQIFLRILDTEPILVRRMLEITANRLRSSSERESALAFLDAQARLARLLLQLEQHAEKGYITISQEEMAQHTGQTRQTVAKALGRWRRAGWLLTGRGHIMLLKHESLANLFQEWIV